MEKMRKSICIMLLTGMMGIVLCGCGEEEGNAAVSTQPETVKYEETDFAVLPDESITTPEGMLTVNTLQRDREDRVAMYVPEMGMDDGEYYQQVTEYALDQDGNWERKNICEKSLTKRVIKKGGSWINSIPYVIRGDDGELYALLQMESPVIAGEEPTEEDEESTPSVRYSVLQLDEEQDQFYEVSLRLEDRSLSEVDTSPDMLKKFHVMEDGTLFFVFGNRSAVQFDADSGAPVAVCENVPDNAFTQNICYGDKQFVFYSLSNKLLNILDLDTMTITKTFGEDVPENDRKKEWCFDTHTNDWNMFGFNLSGLYSIRPVGKNVSIQKLSRDGSFDKLGDATIYDIQVDEEKNVYILLRKRPDDSYDYQNAWEFGVYKYSAAK